MEEKKGTETKKELTIEDYAKAYKALAERARALEQRVNALSSDAMRVDRLLRVMSVEKGCFSPSFIGWCAGQVEAYIRGDMERKA